MLIISAVLTISALIAYVLVNFIVDEIFFRPIARVPKARRARHPNF